MPQTTDAIMMAIVGSAFHREIYYGDQITLFATGVGQFLSASLYTGVQTAFEAQMHETFTIVDPMNPFGMPGTVPVFAEARVAFRTFEQQYLTCTRKSFPTRSNLVANGFLMANRNTISPSETFGLRPCNNFSGVPNFMETSPIGLHPTYPSTTVSPFSVPVDPNMWGTTSPYMTAPPIQNAYIPPSQYAPYPSNTPVYSQQQPPLQMQPPNQVMPSMPPSQVPTMQQMTQQPQMPPQQPMQQMTQQPQMPPQQPVVMPNMNDHQRPMMSPQQQMPIQQQIPHQTPISYGTVPQQQTMSFNPEANRVQQPAPTAPVPSFQNDHANSTSMQPVQNAEAVPLPQAQMPTAPPQPVDVPSAPPAYDDNLQNSPTDVPPAYQDNNATVPTAPPQPMEAPPVYVDANKGQNDDKKDVLPAEQKPTYLDLTFPMRAMLEEKENAKKKEQQQ
jgi:hypothetical protein